MVVGRAVMGVPMCLAGWFATVIFCVCFDFRFFIHMKNVSRCNDQC